MLKIKRGVPKIHDQLKLIRKLFIFNRGMKVAKLKRDKMKTTDSKIELRKSHNL